MDEEEPENERGGWNEEEGEDYKEMAFGICGGEPHKKPLHGGWKLMTNSAILVATVEERKRETKKLIMTKNPDLIWFIVLEVVSPGILHVPMRDLFHQERTLLPLAVFRGGDFWLHQP